MDENQGSNVFVTFHRRIGKTKETISLRWNGEGTKSTSNMTIHSLPNGFCAKTVGFCAFLSRERAEELMREGVPQGEDGARKWRWRV